MAFVGDFLVDAFLPGINLSRLTIHKMLSMILINKCNQYTS